MENDNYKTEVQQRMVRTIGRKKIKGIIILSSKFFISF